MGDFVKISELKVEDVFRFIGYRGATGQPHKVTTVRTMQVNEPRTVIEFASPQGNVTSWRIHPDDDDNPGVERLTPITYGEITDAVSLMAHGDVLYFVAFDGRLYA